MTEAQPLRTPASGSAPTRIGNVERQQAMDALDVHMSAGRLDPDEYGERVGRASVARTTADLEPLFADLPAPHGTGAVTPTAGGSTRSGPARSSAARPAAPLPAPGWTPPAPSTPPDLPQRRRHNGREPLGGRVGEVLVGVSPFVAAILFVATRDFLSEAWLFFLLIPIVGAVVYGHDHDHGHGNRR